MILFQRYFLFKQKTLNDAQQLIILNQNMLQDLCQVTHSINFAKSDDGEESDQYSSPERQQKNSESFKCFSCYGKNKENCQQCCGTQRIMGSHPLVRLLNSVLMRKINCKKGEELHEAVETIKEEEEETEQKKILCSFCEIQCETVVYYCPHCPWFHVCTHCQHRHSEHCHEAIKNPSSLLCGHSVELSIKLCYSCSRKIENCYTVCKTCSQRGDSYWICDLCSDSDNFTHDLGHIMEPMIDFDSFKDNQIETVSQEFQQQSNESIELDQEIQKKQEKQEKIEQNQPDVEDFPHQMRLNKKNSSIALYVDQGDQSPLYNNNLVKKNELISRVRFEIDGLFSSYDFQSDVALNSKNILKPPTCYKHEDRFSCTVSQSSKRSTYKENNIAGQNNDYIFSGYQCDVCKVHPIKNVKYHCKECENFDVCQKCFEGISKTHQHNQCYFERADGKEIKERALQKLIHCNEVAIKGNLSLSQRKTTRCKTVRFNSILG